MREIEIKAQVQDRDSLLDSIAQKQIKLSEPIKQRDRVFGMPGENGGGHNTLPWLRIRTESKEGETKHIFTFKKSVTNQMDSIEYETEVADEAELEKMVLGLGFEPYSDLTKVQRKTRIGDIELCYDDVNGLGEFVEAEKLVADDADYEIVAAELWALLEDLGIVRDHQVHDGYDVLGRKRDGLPVVL